MSDKHEMMKKAAQKMLQLHSENKGHMKRAHAIRLIYKQAELGCGDVPRTHSELDEKIASLLNQDLNVIEKALELTGGRIKLGEVDTNDPSVPKNAEEMFEAVILGD